MNLILENAFAISLFGIVSVLVVSYVWLRTGITPLLYSAIGLMILTILCLAIEQFVETDREQLIDRINEVASFLLDDDMQSVLDCVDAEATEIRAAVNTEMSRYTFKRISIKEERLTLDHVQVSQQQPPRVITRFNVVVVLSAGAGGMDNRPIPRFVAVTFVQRGGKWLISDFEHYPADRGFKKNRDQIY